MSNPTFTPGPWNAEDGEALVFAANGLRVADAHCDDQPDMSEDQEDANARLIAAAPELYAALTKLRDQVETWAESEDSDGHSEIVNWTEMCEARAALALVDAPVSPTGESEDNASPRFCPECDTDYEAPVLTCPRCGIRTVAESDAVDLNEDQTGWYQQGLRSESI